MLGIHNTLGAANAKGSEDIEAECQMPLIQGKGEPIPEVPLVSIEILTIRNMTGYTFKFPHILSVDNLHFYNLTCGHLIETCNVDSVDEPIPCRRCWEALLGTEDAE